ncbi:zinc ribbon domain-containing protein [Dyella sp.]|uniref:zinc ribbon domain-containing protein n=1 Tax=Dyella sp. TaxID=1869338 RepID=UPI002ED0A3FA
MGKERMAYEYGSSAQRLDFPNPYRVENIFRMVAAAILIVCGFYALILARSGLGAHLDGWSLAPIIIGVGMLAGGIKHAATAFSRLRFFFGRGKPEGLAGELAEGQLGEKPDAPRLKATMRGGAIAVEEPRGALNGLLYSMVRPLIWAPQPIQWVAQLQFRTGLTLIVVLLALLVTMLGVLEPHDLAWLGLFFFIYTAALLFVPLERGALARTYLGPAGLIVLVLVAILAPVLIHSISPHLRSLGGIDLSWQALLLLVCAIVAVVVFFVALLRQMVAPPPTLMACEIATVSMNAPPNQVLVELDREMQRGWVEQIPNRRYARHVPQTIGAAGSFSGELLEETQPMPRDDMRKITLRDALREPRYRWLTLLSGLGVAYTLACAVALLMYAHKVVAHVTEPVIWEYICFAGGMFSLATFCLRAGHILWSRFDFTSRLTWVEVEGNFQRSNTAIGAQFTDRVRTEKEIISVNDMTMRVWVAEVDSVTFGADSPRRMIGLRGRPDLAKVLREHLQGFAEGQSSVDMPHSRADVEKIAAMNAMNRASGAADTRAALQNVVDSVTPPAPPVMPRPRPTHCPRCGHGVTEGAKFCGECGAALA